MSAARYSWYASGGGFEGGIGTNKLEVRPSMPQSSPTRRCSRYRRNRRCGTDRTATRIAAVLTLDKASATKNIRTGTNAQQTNSAKSATSWAGARGDGRPGHLNISRPRLPRARCRLRFAANKDSSKTVDDGRLCSKADAKSLLARSAATDSLLLKTDSSWRRCGFWVSTTGGRSCFLLPYIHRKISPSSSLRSSGTGSGSSQESDRKPMKSHHRACRLPREDR